MTEALPAPAAPRQERGTLVLGGAAIFLLAFAAYWPALRGQFVWDDIMLVQGNPLVTGHLGLGSIWFRTDFPLANVALWAQWQLWGDHPAGYHAVNVLLHIVGAIMLWRVLARLRIPGGWLAAVLFTVHPVCAASVAWVSELKNTLSLPFYLLSVWLFVGFEERQTEGQKAQAAGRYLLSLGAFLLALLSKTSTVMLPVVLLGCAWWQRGRITIRDLVRTGPFLLLSLAFGVMTVRFQAHGAIVNATVQSENFWGRLAGAGTALWFYLGKALLPLHLSMIYPRWSINPVSPAAHLPLLLWCGLLGLCWWFRQGLGRHVLFGLGCFTVNLLPVNGLLNMYFLALSRVSDHFDYLPLTAIAALAAAGLCRLPGTLMLRIGGGALVLALSLLTAQRAQVFATEEALWRDTLDRNPDAWIAHANLGWILADQRKYDEAISHLDASLKLNPNNAQAHCNLGRVLSLQGRFAEAQGQFQAALKLKPSDAAIRRSYASALADEGKKEAAIGELREALRLRPDAETRIQLAGLLQQAGQGRAAASEYRQALRRQPGSVEALSNLAWLLATSSDASLRSGPEAVRLAEEACRRTDFKEAQPVGVLAAAYAEAGQFAKAVETQQQAVELATASGDAQFAALNRRLLDLYQAGRAYHEPAPAATGAP
ncbi:MAG TPA: tetratricopeptide repeat protein [Candidatus Acidoferrum sp.]|nr:tetratricopeptide repeat protein [Candidatus Acidoferrum sp.]